MKFTQVLVPLAIAGSASAFAPTGSTQRAPFVSKSALFSEEEASEPAPGGALVPLKEETVEFTAGILGGVAGFAIAGPLGGAIAATTANYISKTDTDVSEIVTAVSKSTIQIYNYLSKIDTKYELLKKASDSLEKAIDKVKSNPSVDPAVLEKLETSLATTKGKIEEINGEYDLVGSGVTALGVVGELVESAIKKAGELNSDYQLTDKAISAVTSAVDKVKTKVSERL
eukprot:CAMPEP_0118697822 /NCGR_PEP_ID=MMETSP0800-20121206/14780_1 /TAXON_ID=210618 ORGANISM="Striatella unipunctata, Strain CCMP2910" /NCGR_SAMPLE_ID=MMETSP0800 /ASSEMBLY_ACC=CAM_ASM_000638 /LENGTH=227 /DNA_ID=CAMNT_0006597417 /DNA_START=141 /DNA_END=824 /DNA_ORIENTATION=-